MRRLLFLISSPYHCEVVTTMNLYHNHQPLKSTVSCMPTMGRYPHNLFTFFFVTMQTEPHGGYPPPNLVNTPKWGGFNPSSVLSTQLDKRGGFNPSPWFNPFLCFSRQCGWFYPFQYIQVCFDAVQPMRAHIFLTRLDVNREGYDPSLCIFDVINANTTTTTKPTPFVGYYCTPGVGREEKSSCLYVHHFFLSFFKNLFCSCNEGFPSQCLYKMYMEGQQWKKIIQHRHLLRVSLLAHHHSAPLRALKRHPMDMPFCCPLFPAFLKQDKTFFVGSSLACHHPHPLSNNKAPLLSFVPF